MALGFPEVVLVVGALLVLVSALSGLAHGTVLSISVVAVAVGVAFGELEIVSVDPTDPVVVAVIELALVFTLFSDGLVVERELLLKQARNTARALVLAMPMTMGLIAVGAKLLFDQLTWAEALLLGAVLAPTDPVITSTVVAAKEIPARLRHVLRLESGLNDGLALPFVLFLIVVADQAGAGSSDLVELLGETAVGLVLGVALALAAGRLLKALPGHGMAERYEGVYALGVSLIAFGLAEVTFGNGLIATFVAGIVLGTSAGEIPDAFPRFNESLGAVLQSITFFLFGVLLVATGAPAPVVAAAGFVAFVLLIARPVAILASFTHSQLPLASRGFVAWFGPKGVASMLFAIFVLKSGVADRELIFQLASVAILTSIVAHGLTDTLGARWIDGRLREAEVDQKG